MLDDLMITVIPHTARHARRLYGLPLHHREPFDRMLIATALVEDIPVLTPDREFLKYRDIGLKVIPA
jgi:PIN domain nuclease of toxin-antitoxin system